MCNNMMCMDYGCLCFIRWSSFSYDSEHCGPQYNILYGLYNKYLVGIPYTRIVIYIYIYILYIVAIGLVGKNKQVVKIKGEKKMKIP